MSIEQSPASGASRAAASGVAGHGRGKAQGGPGTATPAGGFASLLLSLGADDTAEGAALGADLGGTLDLLADPATLASGVPALPVDVELLPADQLLAQALQQAGQGAQAAMPAEGGSSLLPAGVPTPDTGVTALAPAPGGLLAVAGQSGRKVAGTETSDLAEALADPATDQTSAPRELPAAAQEQARHVGVAAQRTAQRQQVAELAAQAVQSARVEQAQEGRAFLAAPGGERQTPGAGLAQMLQAAGLGEATGRLAERRADKQVFRPIGSAEGGAWGGSAAFDAAGRLDMPTTSLVPGLSPEARVAEQVSYWIGRGVQSAEMEVEGLGEGPVQVSIELQGQEARVEFRADQAQTRQVLEDATSHLRELLEREGLVLSGVSVGNSGGQGEAGNREHKPRADGRQATVAVPDVAAAVLGAANRATPLSGRSVDLFV